MFAKQSQDISQQGIKDNLMIPSSNPEDIHSPSCAQNPPSSLNIESFDKSKQISRRELYSILQNCGLTINLNEAQAFMKKVFLQRFHKGTHMIDGLFASPKQIKCASISKLNEGIKKWIEIEGIQTVNQSIVTFTQKYFPLCDNCISAFPISYSNEQKNSSQNIMFLDQVHDDVLILNSNQNLISERGFKCEQKDIPNLNDSSQKYENEIKSFV
jgi:hypothetical protein